MLSNPIAVGAVEELKRAAEGAEYLGFQGELPPLGLAAVGTRPKEGTVILYQQGTLSHSIGGSCETGVEGICGS